MNVTVKPLPVASIVPGGPTTFCAGGSVTLDAGAGFASYAWSNGASTRTIDVNASGSYSVTVTGAGGCVSLPSAAVNVTVTPLPVASIVPGGPTAFCAGGSVRWMRAPGLASYAWSNGASTRTILVNASGSYTVTVIGAGGCVSLPSAAVNVTVTPLPVASIVPGGPTTFCAGGSVTLDAGAGFASYAWSNGASTRTIRLMPAGATP